MTKGDRLRDLQVGETRHRGRRFALGEIQHVELKLTKQNKNVIDRVTQEKADVGCNLIVARAAGMQALSLIHI